MLKNILNLENVQKIDKKQQKTITGGMYALDLPITAKCKGDQRCCRQCGIQGGQYDGGICICSMVFSL